MTVVPPAEAALEGAVLTIEDAQRPTGLAFDPKGGSLVIHFYSDEELNALVERLLGDS